MDKQIIKRPEGPKADVDPEQEGLFEQVVHEPSPEDQAGEQFHSESRSNVVPFNVPESKPVTSDARHAVSDLTRGKTLTHRESIDALNSLISGGGDMDPSELVDRLSEIQDQTEDKAT